MGLRDECLEMGRASLVLSSKQQGLLPAWCIAVTDILQDRAKALIRASQGQVVLIAYSGDATPVIVRETLTSASSVPGTRTFRQGSKKHDFYLQRIGVKTLDVSGVHVAVVPSLPLSLSEGKKTGNLVRACLETIRPYLECARPPTLVISHYCFDRAVMAPVSRRMMQWHRGGLPGAAHSDRVEDLTLCTGCACHDVQNALKWSLSAYLSGGALSLEILAVLSGLRKHVVGFWAVVPSFLTRHLRFRSWKRDASLCYEFWCAIGVESNLLDAFVELDPEWSQGMLYVNPDIEADEDVCERVSLHCRSWCCISSSLSLTPNRVG